MKYHAFVIAISLMACNRPAEKVNGQLYAGKIHTAKKSVSIELSIDMVQKEASISSSLGIRDMKVSLVKLDDSLTFTVSSYSVSYHGKLLKNGDIISGVWKQGGKSYELVFERQERSRSDSAVSDNTDFDQKEVIIDVNPTLRLAGTLTLPRGNQPCPSVILLGVAGKTDRDQSFGPYRSFKHIAEYLTKSGFAVLRCDDRGVGGSDGSLYSTSYDELVGDAMTMITYLRQLPGLNPKKVGVLGISEGAALGGILAAKGQVDFAVLLSYPALPGSVTILQQIKNLSTTYEFNERQTNLLLSDFNEIHEIVLNNSNPEIRKEKVKKHLAAASAETKNLTRYLFVPQDIEEATELYSGSWYKTQLTYAPAQFIRSIRCPTLFLYGNRDPFVNFKHHIPALEQEFKANVNVKPEIHLLKNVNHIFQDASTESPLNYIENNSEFSREAQRKIELWLRNMTE